MDHIEQVSSGTGNPARYRQADRVLVRVAATQRADIVLETECLCSAKLIDAGVIKTNLAGVAHT